MAAHQAPCPRDSPGKNTGVGCHFPLQNRKVKSESEVAQSLPTPSDPMDCSLPGSSIHGTLQARVLEWVATALSKKKKNVRTSEISKVAGYKISVQKSVAFLCTNNKVSKQEMKTTIH